MQSIRVQQKQNCRVLPHPFSLWGDIPRRESSRHGRWMKNFRICPWKVPTFFPNGFHFSWLKFLLGCCLTAARTVGSDYQLQASELNIVPLPFLLTNLQKWSMGPRPPPTPTHPYPPSPCSRALCLDFIWYKSGKLVLISLPNGPLLRRTLQ